MFCKMLQKQGRHSCVQGSLDLVPPKDKTMEKMKFQGPIGSNVFIVFRGR